VILEVTSGYCGPQRAYGRPSRVSSACSDGASPAWDSFHPCPDLVGLSAGRSKRSRKLELSLATSRYPVAVNDIERSLLEVYVRVSEKRDEDYVSPSPAGGGEAARVPDTDDVQVEVSSGWCAVPGTR